MQDLGTILGVWAHPDDENYLSGGIMARAVDAGSRVVCITATKGEKGSWDEERWPSERMGDIREAELMETLRILGVKEHHWLGFIDGECDRVPDEEAVGKIAALIEEIQPDTVLTFGPDGQTGHPDHICMSRWATAAFRKAAKPGATLHYSTTTPEWAAEFVETFNRFNVFEGDTPRITPEDECSIHLVCEGELLERKYRAGLAQVSQIDVLVQAFPPDFLKRAMAHESFVPADPS